MTEPTHVPQQVAVELRRALLRLAKVESDRAAEESSRVAYWEPLPATVVGHRAAAAALILEADSLLRLAC